MLVLARRANESVMIGDDIIINVVEVRGEQVKLGFVAPRSIPVYRSEIYEEMKAANAAAQQTGATAVAEAKARLSSLSPKKPPTKQG